MNDNPAIEQVRIEPVPYKAQECAWCGEDYRSAGNKSQPWGYCSKVCQANMAAAAAEGEDV